MKVFNNLLSLRMVSHLIDIYFEPGCDTLVLICC